MNNPTIKNNGGSGSVFSQLLRPFKFFFQLLSTPILAVFGAVAKLVLFVFFAPLQILLKITFISKHISKHSHDADAVEHLERESAELAGRLDYFESLLVRGQRREYAELVAPPSKYPTLYAHVPEDLKRSIVSDGRIVNGDAPASALAGLALTPEFVARAWASSTRKAVRIAYTLLIFSVLVSIVVSWGAAKMQLQAVAHGQSFEAPAPVLNDLQLAQQYADIWSPKDAVDLREKVAVVDHSPARAAAAAANTAAFVQGVLMFTLLAIAAIIFSIAAARLVWIGRLRYLVHAAVDASVDGLRHSWREALQRWRWRLPEREMELANYNDQVHFATQIDKSPLIEIGTSLGVLEHRGHLLAPEQHQKVEMSVADLFQHVSVLGSSGEGKSRNVYVPVVLQLLKLRAAGYPIALVATDDKGAIGADILDAAREAGIPDSDILTIGTGPNDYRVDVLSDLEPVELADIVKSVAVQAGGDGGDAFWKEMASHVILCVATVLQVCEFTRYGELWVAENGMRMYSLLNILRVASSDAEIDAMLQVVNDARLDRNGQYHTIAHMDKTSLETSIDYLTFNWLSMVDATKDGLRANVQQSLRSFAFKEDVARGFADGAGDNLIPASALLSNKVKIINVSQIEHGSAGRLISILLKTLLFKQARASEQQDPKFAKERLNWWFNPVLGSDTDKYAVNVFLADEYQALITSSGSDGISDSSFWNVARSCGVSGFLFSQSVSAYKLAIGDKATDNILANWRTKIFLRTEDFSTLEAAKKLAGKTMRFQSMDWNHMESAVAVRRETGVCAESFPSVYWDDSMDDIPLILTPGHFGDFEFAGYQKAYEIDERFIPGVSFGQPNTNALQSEQAAAWREEDRTSGILQHGSSDAEAVNDQDLMSMGRARALVYVQRAGGTRVEFVKLNG